MQDCSNSNALAMDYGVNAVLNQAIDILANKGRFCCEHFEHVEEYRLKIQYWE